MSVKTPYGIRVRVLGSAETGYRIEHTDDWTLINRLLRNVYWFRDYNGRGKYMTYGDPMEATRAAKVLYLDKLVTAAKKASKPCNAIFADIP